MSRQVKGNEVWEWPERDKEGNCTRCLEHPLHCLCGKVVGQIKRYSLEELRELGQQFMRETALGEGESYLAGDFLDWLGGQA